MIVQRQGIEREDRKGTVGADEPSLRIEHLLWQGREQPSGNLVSYVCHVGDDLAAIGRSILPGSHLERTVRQFPYEMSGSAGLWVAEVVDSSRLRLDRAISPKRCGEVDRKSVVHGK